jgi:hypothetical protein
MECKLLQKQDSLKVKKVLKFKLIKDEKRRFAPSQIAGILKEYDIV